MQHLISKISMWAALTASVVALSACGGGSGDGGRLNTTWLEVWPSGDFECMAGVECGYWVTGGGYPFEMVSSAPKVIPNRTIDKSGYVSITAQPGSIPANTSDQDKKQEVILNFKPGFGSYAGGSARDQERKVTYTILGTNSSNPSLTPSITQPTITLVPVPGYECSPAAANCVAFDGKAILRVEFKPNETVPDVMMEWVSGDWQFGSTFTAGATVAPQQVTCTSGGVCTQEIAVGPSGSSTTGEVEVNFQDPVTKLVIPVTLVFSIDKGVDFRMGAIGNWGATAPINCGSGPGGVLVSGGIGFTKDPLYGAVLPLDSNNQPLQGTYDPSFVVSQGAKDSTYPLQLNFIGSGQKVDMVSSDYSGLTAAEAARLNIYQNGAPKSGRIDVEVKFTATATGGVYIWKNSIYCQ